MGRLAELRKIEVTKARTQAWGNSAKVGIVTFFGAAMVTLGTGGVAVPFTGPSMASSCGWSASSLVTRDILRDAEDERWKRRLKACAKLQRHFSRLQKLFAQKDQRRRS
jgi:hypothetical protein